MERDWVQLAERASAGDRAAFATLVQRTHVVAYRLALRMLGGAAEAEDALQDAYLRAWNQRASLRDPAAVRGWIYGIVRNVAWTRARSRARRDAHETAGDPEMLERLATLLSSDRPAPDDAAATAQLRDLVLASIEALDDKSRVVLLLRAADGMSYDELAEALGVPVGTIESRLHRARHKLSAKLRRALGRELEVTG